MKELVRRLTSRKFLLAVSAATAFLAAGDQSAALTVVLAYLGVQATIDHREVGKV